MSMRERRRWQREFYIKTGQIRKAGRVDHKDAFLDTEELEKARGITIFSKQAVLKLNETEVTLLDTPGHVDFSAEMERTLQVMDYAVLLISGANGVQGHVETLWRLLARYEIPVFLFINKMDQPGTDAEKLLEELQSRLSEHCLNFSQDLQNAELLEELAMCDEDVLEQYLETGSVEEDQIRTMIAERKRFSVLLWLCTQDGGRDGISENSGPVYKNAGVRRGFWCARF